jgi:hypothetical protein
MKIIFDLDDQSTLHNALPKLKELKMLLPNLKVNLFTIPLKTSLELMNEMSTLDWVRVYPHGVRHNSNFEFARAQYSWVQSQFKYLYKRYGNLLNKGFKAPGWQISTDAMRWFRDNGYWVAIQWSDGRLQGHPDGPFQPKPVEGLKYYALNDPKPPDVKAIHGHTWETCGNGLTQLWPQLIQLSPNDEFLFIDEYIKQTNQPTQTERTKQ